MGHVWLLCSYRVSREPTRLRLGIWRRLKRLGAVPVHDAVWALPFSPETRESVEWIAEEVVEQGGAMMIWEASSLTADQDEAMAQMFRAEADRDYGSILSAAKSLHQRLAARNRRRRESRKQALRQLGRLERLYRLQRRRDFFRAPHREPTEAALSALRTVVEALSGEGRSRSRARPRARGQAHAVGD